MAFHRRERDGWIDLHYLGAGCWVWKSSHDVVVLVIALMRTFSWFQPLYAGYFGCHEVVALAVTYIS